MTNGGKISLALFDLDGTLVDSQYDLTSAVNFIRKSYGLEPISVAQVASYLGSGIVALVETVLPGVGKHELPKAVSSFKDFYSVHLLDMTKPYDGVYEMLLSLGDIKKVVLSNKSENFSKDIISRLGLEKFFEGIYGGNSFDEKKPSPKPVCEIINVFGALKENAVMVGDGANDICAGKAAGIKTIGVLYGYSPKEKVEKLQPSFIAEKPRDVINILRSI